MFFGLRCHTAMTDAPGGSLTVRFTAGGIEEMYDHLIRWGDRVRIIAPESLRATRRDRIEAAGQALRDH
ncbi:WYL domain-containing protein [Paracoccus sp. 228]|uniref:WYL domain-containing protein n=1 Tax=Paracoccus sp. 228 TaxID=1192054 RepID=UPI000A0558E7